MKWQFVLFVYLALANTTARAKKRDSSTSRTRVTSTCAVPTYFWFLLSFVFPPPPPTRRTHATSVHYAPTHPGSANERKRASESEREGARRGVCARFRSIQEAEHCTCCGSCEFLAEPFFVCFELFCARKCWVRTFVRAIILKEEICERKIVRLDEDYKDIENQRLGAALCSFTRGKKIWLTHLRKYFYSPPYVNS
jgi:hypothetical protein